MKYWSRLACVFFSSWAFIQHAAIIVPGANGVDGELNIVTNTVIDLCRAISAPWDSNISTNAGKGVYDSNKWAVVFKYTKVTVASNATITFKNHLSRAPVVWLVNGDVNIHGTVNVDGAEGIPVPGLAEPGPGGFRGGMGPGGFKDFQQGAGFGPGGGKMLDGNHGSGGSYLTSGRWVGIPNGTNYGNSSVIPLIGGSGGSGGFLVAVGGGAGGGAVLIACERTVHILGRLTANGGGTPSQGGAGSGGAVRIIANEFIGSGRIECLGGHPGYDGGLGRIRIERVLVTSGPEMIPDTSPVTITAGSQAILWPPGGSPEVRIVSIGGVNAPVDPRAAFGTLGADVALPLSEQVDVIVETRNVAEDSFVYVRGTPRSNGSFKDILAARDGSAPGDPTALRWKAELPVNMGYSAVQVRVVRR